MCPFAVHLWQTTDIQYDNRSTQQRFTTCTRKHLRGFRDEHEAGPLGTGGLKVERRIAQGMEPKARELPKSLSEPESRSLQT